MTDAEAYAGQWVMESEVHNITSGPVETDDGEKRLKHLLVEEGISANCCAHRGGMLLRHCTKQHSKVS